MYAMSINTVEILGLLRVCVSPALDAVLFTIFPPTTVVFFAVSFRQDGVFWAT